MNYFQSIHYPTIDCQLNPFFWIVQFSMNEREQTLMNIGVAAQRYFHKLLECRDSFYCSPGFSYVLTTFRAFIIELLIVSSNHYLDCPV